MHLKCNVPALKEVPVGDWFCPCCVAARNEAAEREAAAQAAAMNAKDTGKRKTSAPAAVVQDKEPERVVRGAPPPPPAAAENARGARRVAEGAKDAIAPEGQGPRRLEALEAELAAVRAELDAEKKQKVELDVTRVRVAEAEAARVTAEAKAEAARMTAEAKKEAERIRAGAKAEAVALVRAAEAQAVKIKADAARAGREAERRAAQEKDKEKAKANAAAAAPAAALKEAAAATARIDRALAPAAAAPRHPLPIPSDTEREGDMRSVPDPSAEPPAAFPSGRGRADSIAALLERSDGPPAAARPPAGRRPLLTDILPGPAQQAHAPPSVAGPESEPARTRTKRPAMDSARDPGAAAAAAPDAKRLRGKEQPAWGAAPVAGAAGGRAAAPAGTHGELGEDDMPCEVCGRHHSVPNNQMLQVRFRRIRTCSAVQGTWIVFILDSSSEPCSFSARCLQQLPLLISGLLALPRTV